MVPIPQTTITLGLDIYGVCNVLTFIIFKNLPQYLTPVERYPINRFIIIRPKYIVSLSFNPYNS